MADRKTVLAIIFLILFGGNIFLGAKYFSLQKELAQTHAELESSKINDKVLNFTKLFVEKVLKAQSEVNFEDRLELENAIRDTNDQEILNQWKKFTDSKDEKGAQNEVKNLLGMLVDKIK